MAPSIKLTYFDLRGRGEAIRLTFLIGNVSYEDDRVKRDEWIELKPKTPYGALPVMHIDDNTGVQSDALLRYAGKISGLYPEDPVKAMYVDEVLDVCEDLGMAIGRYKGKDEDIIRENREKAAKEDVPRYWGGLEKRLEAIGSDEGPYLFGDKVTIADLKVSCMYNSVKSGLYDHFPATTLDDYPKLAKSYSAVMALPEVVEWYKKYKIPNVSE